MAMTKEEFFEVLRAYASREFQDLPKEKEISHEFSPDFEKKMNELFEGEESDGDGEEETQLRRRKKKTVKFKVLLIAAILAAMLLAANFTAMAFGVDTVAILRAFGDRLVEMVVGEREEFMDVEIIKVGEYFVNYDTIEEFIENENLNILFPTCLPENIAIKEITVRSSKNVGDSGNSKFKSIGYVFENSPNITLSLNTCIINNGVFNNHKEEIIGDFNCFILESDDMSFVQVYFIHNNFTYKVTAPTREDVVLIIEGLKEHE